MTRATGPIINSKAAYRDVMNQIVDDVCDQLEFSSGKVDLFMHLPLVADKIVTVLMRPSSPTTLRFELLAGEESKDPKPRWNDDKTLKPVADVRLTPTGIKKVTMR